MTAEPSFAADRSERPDGPDGPDLSSAFGRPATSSLRGILPPRPRRSTEQTGAPTPVPGEPGDEAIDDALDDAVDATDAVPAEEPVDTVEAPPEADTPVAAPHAADLVPAPRTRRRGAPTTGVANRRWGTARVASREHVELLVLVSLGRGPADGRELAARLRDDSAGGLAPPPTTLQRTLHHLARHGLVERVDTDRRRYRLTILGTRIARARVRAWRAMRRAVDAVVAAAEDD
ncbi:PadR family transcriptional regulator [Actinomycetospora rhizophila]|uniref:PadR family transcriptional regulator n=1 Tax=Actinomycetospora rhizophila TaxID=1416876 RepID=A0ABV9ZMW5_9PSEU